MLMEYLPLRVHPIRLHNGERFPIVLYKKTGLPLFYPNTYLSAKIRGKGDASGSMANAGHAIKCLWAWAAIENIDILERMLKCDPLDPTELDSLAHHLRQKYKAMLQRRDDLVTRRKPKNSRSTSKGHRRNPKSTAKTKKSLVKSSTTSQRLTYVIDFLDYLKEIGLRSVRRGNTKKEARDAMDKMLDSLRARIPKDKEDETYKRHGLAVTAQEILWELLEETSSLNPWAKAVRARNKLIIMLLFGLGIRRGELLNINLDDIHFRKNKIFIRRLPDNPEDPRLYEPNVKTLPRWLKMRDALVDALEDYIINYRGRFKGANKHGFLIVSSRNGAPLSLSGLNHVFDKLKETPGLPLDISPHTGRHTWNDNFSDECDEKKVLEKKEIETRCKLMGWVKGSQMARTYTRRHIEEKAEELSLNVQKKIFRRHKGGFVGDIYINEFAD